MIEEFQDTTRTQIERKNSFVLTLLQLTGKGFPVASRIKGKETSRGRIEQKSKDDCNTCL